MAERSFEFGNAAERGKVFIIESNAEALARSLNSYWWYEDKRARVARATLELYVSDTGNLCGEDDPLLAGKYMLHFERNPQVGAVFCISSLRTHTYRIAPFEEVDEIVEVSAQRAAEQLGEFPRYLSERESGVGRM